LPKVQWNGSVCQWLKDGQGNRLVDSHLDFSDHKEAVKMSGGMRPSDIIAKMRNPGPGMTKFDKNAIPDKTAQSHRGLCFEGLHVRL
jgi:hypothetical protein